jgi:polyferredoxin
MKRLFLSLSLLVWSLIVPTAFSEQRFPPPDFESGHKLPEMTTPLPRAEWLAWADVAILAACLGTATYLIYRRRSRKGLIALSLFSLAYFGFYRNGCICAIGSVQNVALALAGQGYAAPVTAILFFTLPLGVALFAGRAFCAGVCPHGALQDLVLLKPIKLPAWLEHGLSVLPFVYLGAGVLFAATGSAFIICQYDPFVPVFRLNGRVLMVAIGVALLLLGMFVGRPYCRFLCPYGALLKMGAVLSRRRIRVTPDHCTQCTLCSASCPFGAMRQPEVGRPDPAALKRDRVRLAILLVAVPLLIAGGAWLGRELSETAARVHPRVALAARYLQNREAPPRTGALSPAELELQRARENPRELLLDAARIRRQFEIGTAVFGGWVGLVIAAKLISLSLRRNRTDYEPDRGDCVGCARCFEYCPNELVRRGIIAQPPVATAPEKVA